MSIILLLFLMVCLVGGQIAKPEKFYSDYMQKENTICIQGLFVFLVFFRHFLGYVSLSGSYDRFATAFNNKMEQLLVVMFLFYSGYGIMKSIIERGRSYVHGIPKKIIKLLIHFDFAVLLYVFLQLIYGQSFSLKTIVLSLVGWEAVGNSNWYIFAVLCMYFSTWISFRFIKRSYYALSSVAVFSVIYVIIMRCYKTPWWYNTIFAYGLGMFYCTLEDNFLAVFSRIRNKVATYCAALVICFGGYFGITNLRSTNSSLNMLWHTFFALVVIIFLLKIRINNAVLSFLGKHVFGIYILQRIPMIVLYNFGFTERHPYQSFLISFFITVFIACIYERILEILDKRLFFILDRKLHFAVEESISYSRISQIECLLFGLSFVLAAVVINVIPITKRHVEITALNEKNHNSFSSQIYLKGIANNGIEEALPEPKIGHWQYYQHHNCWFEDSDERIGSPLTKSIAYDIDLHNNTNLIFSGNKWKGMVQVSVDNEWYMNTDTYVNSDEWNNVRVYLPGVTVRDIFQRMIVPTLFFALVMIIPDILYCFFKFNLDKFDD